MGHLINDPRYVASDNDTRMYEERNLQKRSTSGRNFTLSRLLRLQTGNTL